MVKYSVCDLFFKTYDLASSRLSWAILGSSWCHLGAILVPSWGHLGASCGHLWPSWAILGPSWGHLGTIFGLPRGILGISWCFWGPLGDVLGRLQLRNHKIMCFVVCVRVAPRKGAMGYVGAILGLLCGILAPSPDRLGAAWDHLGASWGNLGAMLGASRESLQI